MQHFVFLRISGIVRRILYENRVLHSLVNGTSSLATNMRRARALRRTVPRRSVRAQAPWVLHVLGMGAPLAPQLSLARRQVKFEKYRDSSTAPRDLSGLSDSFFIFS